MFPFKTALNVSTLFPFELDVIGQINVAAEAGYDGIELWMRDIEAYLADSGTINEIKSELKKHKIEFINAITFFEWADKDSEVREQAFKQAEKEMKLLALFGCQMIAAPPFGNVETVKLDEMADYFGRLVMMGQKYGIEPILEFWGIAKKLSTLAEARYVLDASRITNPKILIDPFHMYIGGSDFSGIKELQGEQIGVFHVNDYPEIPQRDELKDKDRVFPGEGIAPSSAIAQMLYDNHYSGYLSLELFIEDYGELNALEVAKNGLDTLIKSYTIKI